MPTTTPAGRCLIAPIAGGRADWDRATVVDMRPVPQPAPTPRWRRARTLTPRQTAILDFIAAHLDEHGYPPLLRELATGVGLTSMSSVHYQLAELARAGHLTVDLRRARGIRLTRREAS